MPDAPAEQRTLALEQAWSSAEDALMRLLEGNNEWAHATAQVAQAWALIAQAASAQPGGGVSA